MKTTVKVSVMKVFSCVELVLLLISFLLCDSIAPSSNWGLVSAQPRSSKSSLSTGSTTSSYFLGASSSIRDGNSHTNAVVPYLPSSPSGGSGSSPGPGLGSTVSNEIAMLKHIPPDVFRGKICIGTSGRMSVPSNRAHHYRNLKDRYTNCTYVEGNLELTWIQDQEMDLSFLHHIREVTGYVLISHVDVKQIVLPSLQVIRGRTRFRLNVHDDEFALMVTLSRMDNLELPALRDVLAGNVGVFNNYNLCHVKTINWDEIISGPNANYVYVYNFTQSERKCPPCDKSCEAGCWGEGPQNCQKFSKINCSPQCHEGRCYGPEPRQCCHLSCAGGCTGPKKSDCLACKKFYDDGECKDECPSLVIYNPNTYLSERNPAGKYAYGATCVKTCPEHLLRDAGAGACVRQCPRDKEAVNGECVPCNGLCRKKCQGPLNSVIHSGNIDDFRNCTIIEGSIQILETSFNGFQEIHQNFSFGDHHKPMDPSKLEVFSTLREVTGYINIQATHPNFTNLSYFRNLEIIGGRDKAEFFSALYVVKTSLKTLNLRSLKRIRSGTVAFIENVDLCFADTINWKKIMGPKMEPQIHNNNSPENCRKQGQVCSSQCSSEGCWGPATLDCLSCAKFKLGDQCIPSCNSSVGIYEDSPGICKNCHEQCLDTCVGAGPGNCTRCAKVKDGPFCVESCPDQKYQRGAECHKCHDNCLDGCNGPANNIGSNGCNSCQQAIVDTIDDNEVILSCLGKDEPCPDGYFYESVSPKVVGVLKPLAGKSICRKCHPLCKRCTASGFHSQACQECVFYKRGEHCEEATCPIDFYADDDRRECLPCLNECRGCHGPTAQECDSCRHYRVYPDGEAHGDNEVNSNITFTCVESCPVEFPQRIVDEGLEPYCSAHGSPSGATAEEELRSKQSKAVIGGVVICFVALVIFATILGLYCVRAKAKKDTLKMISGFNYDPNEPLRETNLKPNLAKFRTVKEEELRKGGILGCGAFGTVHKGVWIPESGNVKIPVAIKVLRDGTGSNTSREFLDEAYIMASVEHQHLLKLLAVCLSSQLMLVTQLMPLGCLRDYVHNNKDKIGSKALLNWCTQIAKGMEYLESRRLVHRDLAARNVLVHTPTHVKITDFGLAKLLDLDEDEFRAEGGKMPIKWLAIECIRDRVFTHKSDVWAFGVTVWELLTYGGKPYENIHARDVPELLMKGERLQQPPFCSLELYMITIKCWMVNPDDRPNFTDLVDEFTKMSRDPGRFLAIPGDKLMRLPSYTPQDERELIRNLASALDGPELIMGATEYFESQQQLSNSSNSTNNGTLPKRNTYTPDSVAWSESAGVQTYQSRVRDKYRRGGAVGTSGATGSLRYCSDPLNRGDSSAEDSWGQLQQDANGRPHVNNVALDLPVDEDDYLMPCPQNNQNPPTYLDLVSDSQGHESQKHGALHPGRYPRKYAQQQRPVLIDNPEYQLTAREYSNVPLAYAPVGLPPSYSSLNHSNVSHLQQPQHNNNLKNHFNNAQHVPLYHSKPLVQHQSQQPPSLQSFHSQQPSTSSSTVRHGSRSEEESDHEYYNELDRLKREKQPLQARKNETTV